MRTIQSILPTCVVSVIAMQASFSLQAASKQEPATIPAATDTTYPGVLTLQVDLRDVGQKVFRVHEVIPVKPGALVLLYPKWIPGEHGPTGTLDGIAGIKLTANGQPVDWRRDLTEMYALHVPVPAGVSQLDLDFQMLSPTAGGAFGGSVSVTDRLLDLEWNQVLFYPAGHDSHGITFKPAVLLPEGWQYATALQPDSSGAAETQFKPVDLETLVDSPLAAGINFRRIELAAAAPAVHLNVVADRPEYLAASKAQVDAHVALVQEASALFGAHHYQHYDFLLTLSDETGHFGLEHHQSSDDRLSADFFTDGKAYVDRVDLLPHEYVHSWNGKYRRPNGLIIPDYIEPMKDDLLWVYEGQTQYLGEVLTARAGLWTLEQYREHLAVVASWMNHVPGRTWRPLQDTADEAQILYNDDLHWSNWRRGTDFYEEGELLWLNVDTKLRELSHGQKSIDDFTHLFHGTRDGAVTVVGYDFDDIVSTLNQVQHFDWAAFLRGMLTSTAATAPLDGLTRGGWKLVYSDKENTLLSAHEASRKRLDLTDSLGLLIDNGEDAGYVLDVLWQGPAFNAGLAPGMKVVAINGDQFSADALKDAITAAHAAGANARPIELLVKNQSVYRTVKVDYRDGLRYPHLERIDGTPDRLADIAKAHR